MLRRFAQNEQRTRLADHPFHLFGGLLILWRVEFLKPFLRIRKNFVQRLRKFVRLKNESRELDVANLFGLDLLALVDPGLLQVRQVRLHGLGLLAGVHQEQQPLRFIIGRLDERQGHLPLRQAGVIGELDAELAFERLERVGFEFCDELLLERLHRGIVPKLKHRS